jgi:hypothetical protein
MTRDRNIWPACLVRKCRCRQLWQPAQVATQWLACWLASRAGTQLHPSTVCQVPKATGPPLVAASHMHASWGKTVSPTDITTATLPFTLLLLWPCLVDR